MSTSHLGVFPEGPKWHESIWKEIAYFVYILYTMHALYVYAPVPYAVYEYHANMLFRCVLPLRVSRVSTHDMLWGHDFVLSRRDFHVLG